MWGGGRGGGGKNNELLGLFLFENPTEAKQVIMNPWTEILTRIIPFCLVDCRAPGPPKNGLLGQYSHTKAGATVEFWCRSGYFPSKRITAVCWDKPQWEPLPQYHRCSSKQTDTSDELRFVMCILCCKSHKYIP